MFFFLNLILASPETIIYMNSFLNRFNNSMKTTRAHKKWNLTVYKSPEPKVVSIITKMI